jgi:hypothetical protein
MSQGAISATVLNQSRPPALLCGVVEEKNIPTGLEIELELSMRSLVL